jgi:GNAT superfamily N-acetyltransferase
MPAFLWHTFLGTSQVVRADGFSGGRLLVDSHFTFWTLTVWESEQAMKRFRGSGAHSQVMNRLVEWCDEAAYAHWVPAAADIPDWLEAYERLVAEGRKSRVAHPSTGHEAFVFTKPRLRPLIGRDLKPTNSTRNRTS